MRSLSASYDHGHEIGGHAHDWGQLVYAASGAIHVTAERQAWLIPAARAVWLPPGTQHSLRMRGATRLRTLYVPPEHCRGLSQAPLGIAVTALLRELVLELVRIGHVRTAADRRAQQVARMRPVLSYMRSAAWSGRRPRAFARPRWTVSLPDTNTVLD